MSNALFSTTDNELAVKNKGIKIKEAIEGNDPGSILGEPASWRRRLEKKSDQADLAQAHGNMVLKIR